MNRDYEEIDQMTDRLDVMLKEHYGFRTYAPLLLAICSASKRMANRITDLENVLDEANRQLEEILREASDED